MSKGESALNQSTVAFIGGGHMTTSLIGGLVASGFEATQLWVSDPNEDKRERLAKQFGIHTDPSNEAVAALADIIVLAVKPKDMPDVCHELKESIQKRHPLVVSIAAGVQTHHIEKWLGSDIAIVRAMPNTPALLRMGATGLYANTRVTDEERSLAESLLRAVGMTVWAAHEHEMETIAALSGSGPAYFFLVMEALQHGAEALGLPEKTAKILTLQTAMGAARMAFESDVELDVLRKRIASPGGTTEKALDTLETGDIRILFKAALEAAKKRSIEISHQFDDA